MIAVHCTPNTTDTKASFKYLYYTHQSRHWILHTLLHTAQTWPGAEVNWAKLTMAIESLQLQNSTVTTINHSRDSRWQFVRAFALKTLKKDRCAFHPYLTLAPFQKPVLQNGLRTNMCTGVQYRKSVQCESVPKCTDCAVYFGGRVYSVHLHTKIYRYVQACVRVVRHNLTEQDTWWPRSLLTALISLEISKLGSKQRDGMPPHQRSLLVPTSKSPHFYWVLSSSSP